MTRRHLAGLLIAALLLPAGALQAQADAELRIKAAFLFKFGDFVEWPEAAFGDANIFAIGVLGNEPFAAELQQVVAGRSIQGRSIAVRRLRRGEPADGLQIMFIGEGENSRLAEVVAAVRDRPVLIVTEADSSVSRGSMINFVIADNKVRFDIVPAAAERSQLRISSRLLTVARKVIAGRS